MGKYFTSLNKALNPYGTRMNPVMGNLRFFMILLVSESTLRI